MLMTLKEVAQYMRVSTQTVYNMAQSGRLPAFKVGRQWRFRRDEVYNWVIKQTMERQRAKPNKKGR